MCIGFDLDNPRRNADCGVRLGEGKVPSPRALSILSTRSNAGLLFSKPTFHKPGRDYCSILSLLQEYILRSSLPTFSS